MREQVKQQLRDMIATLGRAEGILDSRSKKKDEDAVRRLLEDMQNSAMSIGMAIEEEEGLETETVGCLEEYCELLYRYLTADGLKERFRIGSLLAGKRGEILSYMEEEVEGRIEVVFLLCRADKWGYMENLWDVAKGKPEYDCTVLAASYRERGCTEDGTEEGEAAIPLGNPSAVLAGGPAAIHDELGMFPASVKAMNYEAYDMEGQKPDIVFLDGPYEADGRAGIIPGYDLSVIRECAGIVIYMPSYEDENQVDKAGCLSPQMRLADMIVVQSEKVRDAYKENLREIEDGQEIFKKIGVAGVLKAEKILGKD